MTLRVDLPHTRGSKLRSAELEAPLRHPLEDDVVIGERALVCRNTV